MTSIIPIVPGKCRGCDFLKDWGTVVASGDKEWGYGKVMTFSLSKHEETKSRAMVYVRALTFSLSKQEETANKEWGYGRALTFSLYKHEETAD